MPNLAWPPPPLAKPGTLFFFHKIFYCFKVMYRSFYRPHNYVISGGGGHNWKNILLLYFTFWTICSIFFSPCNLNYFRGRGVPPAPPFVEFSIKIIFFFWTVPLLRWSTRSNLSHRLSWSCAALYNSQMFCIIKFLSDEFYFISGMCFRMIWSRPSTKKFVTYRGNAQQPLTLPEAIFSSERYSGWT